VKYFWAFTVGRLVKDQASAYDTRGTNGGGEGQYSENLKKQKGRLKKRQKKEKGNESYRK
jgi:hypothetical protein